MKQVLKVVGITLAVIVGAAGVVGCISLLPAPDPSDSDGTVEADTPATEGREPDIGAVTVTHNNERFVCFVVNEGKGISCLREVGS